MRWSMKRGLVALAVFLLVVVGLVVHTGIGTPSALGWRDIAAICPVGALEVLAGAKAFLVHPLVLLAVVLAAAFLVGKAFCAWVCPVPHIRNFFRPAKRKGKNAKTKAEGASEGEAAEDEAGADDAGNVAESAGIEQREAAHDAPSPAASDASQAAHDPLPPVGGERDGAHLDSRHFVLLGSVASSFAFGFPVFCLVCPVGLSFAVVIGVWNLFRFNETSWGLIVFPLLILVEVVLFRKWCTTFCPISALLSLVAAKSRTLRPVVEQSACLRSRGVDCRTCVKACPEKVDPHSPHIPECSRCGECADECPAHAISMKLLAPGGKAKTGAQPAIMGDKE